ncbi:MAG: cysteine desulfurase-like protein [Planctomycetes bacterium]|nr:cysteine desulfurase-like protein [Planctomycetota bacterium]
MTTSPATDVSIDPAAVRAWFPALASDTVFLENAGGSQVPRVVADGIRDYMLTKYVQLGAGYPEADAADAVVDGAHAFMDRFVNAGAAGRVILGPSCTRLVGTLAECCARAWEPGDEIVVMESGHEANVGPWTRLAERGFTVRTWKVDPASMTCPIESLKKLLSPRTRMVAMVHVSNLLGGINDVAAVTRLVHGAGARIIVDGVAYAPHRAIDVQRWGVDWYVWSTYKVYGPHMGAMFGRYDAFAELPTPNHFFIGRDDVVYAFEPGGVCHEGCAGLLSLQQYLGFLAGANGKQPIDADRATIVGAYDAMTALELPLQQRLVRWLRERPGFRIVGPVHGEPTRVGTISFVHDRLAPSEIVAAAQARDIGIRNGHMYAHRLCSALGLEPEEGVVRASLVHYNTMDEIDRLIEVLESI